MAKKKSDAVGEERGVDAASVSYRKPGVKRDESRAPQNTARPSALVDTRVIYCGDNLEQLKKLIGYSGKMSASVFEEKYQQV